MSSDCYAFTLIHRDGPWIHLRARTLPAGGLNDSDCSTSFVLLAFERCFRDHPELATTPLARALADVGDALSSATFHTAKSMAIIECAVPGESGIRIDERDPAVVEQFHADLNAAETAEYASPLERENACCRFSHWFVVAAKLASPELAQGLPEGLVWSSTAYSIVQDSRARSSGRDKQPPELPWSRSWYCAYGFDPPALLADLVDKFGPRLGGHVADGQLLLDKRLPWQIDDLPAKPQRALRLGLAGIAQDNWEGHYCYWGLDAGSEDAPVVYVTDTRSSVVARSLRELLSLLRTGMTSPGQYSEDENARVQKDVSVDFAAWCDAHDIPPATSPQPELGELQARFDGWLRDIEHPTALGAGS